MTVYLTPDYCFNPEFVESTSFASVIYEIPWRVLHNFSKIPHFYAYLLIKCKKMGECVSLFLFEKWTEPFLTYNLNIYLIMPQRIYFSFILRFYQFFPAKNIAREGNVSSKCWIYVSICALFVPLSCFRILCLRDLFTKHEIYDEVAKI